MDTIYALSTAPGKAGVAIVRVSGPQASDAAVKLAGTLPKPRVASRRQLAAEDRSFIDDALVLAFEEGASFTGEEVIEFHLHGGLAVINA
ncbi:MAG: tRNA uridine-5-carboxymethylaminomethyl(34) synthesis GTPase MnmE, partial [Pseudomonadota bacterium]